MVGKKLLQGSYFEFPFDIIISPQDYYREALAANHDNTSILFRVGNALFDSSNHTGAIEYHDKVLMMNPNDTSALHNKAKSLHILGNYAGSIEYYYKVLAANPNDTEVLAEIAANFDALGNYTEAIKYLDKTLVIDPNHTTALNNKGVVLYEGYTIQEIYQQGITCMQIIL